MRRAALLACLVVSFLLPAGLFAVEGSATPSLAAFDFEVPQTMGPGAFLVGADTGGAIVVSGPFCDQLDIICDARCGKIGGGYSCVGASSGFCSVSNCGGL